VKKEINKISKLIALSKSDNKYEASTALKNAMKLCAKIDVNIKDIELNTDDLIEEKKITKDKSRIDSTEWQFLVGLGKIFGCEVLRCRHYVKEGFDVKCKYNLEVVGYKKDIEIFEYLSVYLLAQVKKLTRQHVAQINIHGSPYTYKRSYKEGLMYSIIQKAKMVFHEEPKEVQEAYGLVLQRGALVQKMIKDVKPAKRSKNPNINETGLLRGAKDGCNVCIRKAVSETAPKTRVIGG